MYRYASVISLFSFIISLLFLFASFKGYSYWYSGFVFFLWLNLASLNYRHRTTLWRFFNSRTSFIKLFLGLLVFGVVCDFLVGQQLISAWIYPAYTHQLDWIKLYLIIYPFGGLGVLELCVFIGLIFKEHLRMSHKVNSITHLLIDRTNFFLDITLLLSAVILPLLYFINFSIPFRDVFIVASILIWVTTSTIQLIYHFKHGLHWVWISLFSLFLFILLHEIPNTSSYEWRYISSPVVKDTLPFLNGRFMDIPYWVLIGWYVIILVMYKMWTHIDTVYLRELSKSHTKRSKEKNKK